MKENAVATTEGRSLLDQLNGVLVANGGDQLDGRRKLGELQWEGGGGCGGGQGERDNAQLTTWWRAALSKLYTLLSDFFTYTPAS